jgi:hypothetical protein
VENREEEQRVSDIDRSDEADKRLAGVRIRTGEVALSHVSLLSIVDFD